MVSYDLFLFMLKTDTSIRGPVSMPFHISWGESRIQRYLYSAVNDPGPEMIPKLDRKRSPTESALDA